jgi:hypothetical protein
MRARDIAVFLCIAAFATCAASEPDRAKGLSVHMLPDRVAQIDGHSGGFTVGSHTYPDAARLVAYFRTLPAATQENGIWVVTTHPSAYSAAEHEKLRALVTLCQQHKIPVFTCRGSELPGGWKRSQVPTGWDAASDAQ